MSQEIGFSPWVNWTNRNSFARKGEQDQGGVYLFARFERKPPSGSANPLGESVIYIGQSSKRTFKSRWEPFGIAVHKRAGKGRAKRYTDLFGDDLSCLYVAALPAQELVKAFLTLGSCSLLDINISSAKAYVTGDDIFAEIGDLLVKYMERRLILLYACHHKHRPALNVD